MIARRCQGRQSYPMKTTYSNVSRLQTREAHPSLQMRMRSWPSNFWPRADARPEVRRDTCFSELPSQHFCCSFFDTKVLVLLCMNAHCLLQVERRSRHAQGWCCRRGSFALACWRHFISLAEVRLPCPKPFPPMRQPSKSQLASVEKRPKAQFHRK